MATVTDKLIAKKEGGIGWIIFNNPAKRNAMSMDMYLAMADALNDYSRDPAVRRRLATAVAEGVQQCLAKES